MSHFDNINSHSKADILRAALYTIFSDAIAADSEAASLDKQVIFFNDEPSIGRAMFEMYGYYNRPYTFIN